MTILVTTETIETHGDLGIPHDLGPRKLSNGGEKMPIDLQPRCHKFPSQPMGRSKLLKKTISIEVYYWVDHISLEPSWRDVQQRMTTFFCPP